MKCTGSLEFIAPPEAFSTELLIGSPQLGQAGALRDTGLLQAGQHISDIVMIWFFF